MIGAFPNLRVGALLRCGRLSITLKVVWMAGRAGADSALLLHAGDGWPRWCAWHACARGGGHTQVTLETYLMQHHILLTKNAKGILILVADWPLCNLVSQPAS